LGADEVEGVEVRKKTIEAFEAWRADARSQSELVQRIAEGETLKEICASMGVAYSLVARHVAGTPALNAEYEAALAIWGDALAQETLAITDAVAGSTEGAVVAAAKLRAEQRLKLAGKWNRPRYGEREAAVLQVNFSLSDTAREIRELEARLGIGQVVAEQALPALEEKLSEVAQEHPEDI